MAKKISAYDKQRLLHINHLMNGVYCDASAIYESLVDRDYDDLKAAILSLKDKILDLEHSIEDEV